MRLVKITLRRALNCVTLLTVLTATSVASAQIVFEFPTGVTGTKVNVAPYNSAGVLLTEVDGSGYRGSAAVARDPRLLYTCAHVLYDRGIWATSGEFFRAWSSVVAPTDGTGVDIRGYYYYGAYSGGNSLKAFSLDFAICYRTPKTDFGPVLPVLVKAGPSLRDGAIAKLIVGYPATLVTFDSPGYYYMYETGPYSEPMEKVRKSYHWIEGVTTGPGNSGGPVVANIDGTYTLAGMLISGSIFGSGIHGLNTEANTMADIILADLDGVETGHTKFANNTTSKRLPDGSKTYTARKLKVSGAGATTLGTELSLRIKTSFRGDLDIYIRSPSGRVRWVQKHSLAGSGRDLVLKNVDYKPSFYGTNPNGVWNVFMRDFYRDDTAVFKSASLAVRTPVPTS